MRYKDAIRATQMGFIALPYKLNNQPYSFERQWQAATKWMSNYVCILTHSTSYNFDSGNCDVSSIVSSDSETVEVRVSFKSLLWIRPCTLDKVQLNIMSLLMKSSAIPTMNIEFSNIPSGLVVMYKF